MSISATERSLLYASPHPYLIMSADTPNFTIVAANQSFANLIHETEAELIGKSYLDFLSNQPYAIGTEKLQEIAAGLIEIIQHKTNKKYQIEFPVAQIAHAEVFPLLDDKNDVKFLVQTFGGGHRNKESKELIFDNNNDLLENNFQHPLFNDYPDPVFTLDPHGNFLSTNNALVELAECTKEELLKLSFVPFINPLEIDQAFGHFQSAMKGIPQNFKINVISSKGTHRKLDVTNLPLVINNEVIGIHVIARDITEAAGAKEMVQGYNDRIYAILESITDGFFAVDQEWVITYWNKEAERMLGMPKEDALGENLWEVYKDAIPLKFYSEYHRSVSENVAVRFDEYFPPLKLWVEVSAFPSKDGLSVYFKDISFRKDAEALLNSEKEKYLGLFNLSPIPQWVYDIETLCFLDVNNAAIEHYGYSRTEFLSMTLADIRPEKDVDLLKEIISHKVKKGSFNSSVVRHLKKDGKIISVNVEGNSISFEGKHARLALAIDITQKLKTERALEASEHRFKALVQDGSDLIAILNSEGMYKYVSPTSTSILGIDPVKFIGKSAFDFIHQDDTAFVLESFKLLKTTRRIQVPPFRFNIGSGEYRWIDTIVTNMMDEPGVEGLVANSRNITERMQDITQRKAYIEKIEAQNRRLLDISWLQSHYVRAPLSQIMALVKVLTAEHSEAADKESLSYLAEAAEQLDKVIKRIINNTEGT